MNALLILNDGAGSLNGDKDSVSASAVIEAFAEEGVTVQLWNAPSDELSESLKAAAATRPDTIFVGGGDGSMNAAAACLAGTDIALGVIPLGTFNHFARDLGLSTDWRESVKQLASGKPRAVDVSEVNGRVFINNCSIGSYPEAVHRRDALRRSRGLGKWYAMTLASLTVFRRLRRLRLKIDTPAESLTVRTPFMLVGNNAYSGHLFGQYLRPRLDEGRLWIYTTRAHRRLSLLRLAWQSLIRSIDAADALETHQAMEATVTPITTERILPVALDGELADLHAPLRFRIRPQALQVIVGSSETGS